MKIKSIWSILFSFLIVIGVIYYFIVMTPLMTDNYVFSHDIHPGYAKFYLGEKTFASPMTVEAAFRQATEMYYTWCGRFTGNLAVYLLFMLPRWLYNIVAAFGFGLYVLLVEMCVFGHQWRQKLSAAWILGIGAAIWVTIPSFGEAFLWLSVGGQIALMGQAAVFLPFRFALDGIPSQAHPYLPMQIVKCFLGLMLGLFVASLDFPTSAALPPTAVACVCWLYFRDKKNLRKFPLLPICITIGLCIGGALTLAAPGNAQRLLLTTDDKVRAYLDSSWLERIFSWIGHLPGAIFMQWLPLLLLGWACWVLYRRYGRSWFRYLPPASVLFLLPAILTHAAYLFTAWPPARAFATPSMQLLICSFIVFSVAKPLETRAEWLQFKAIRFLFCLFCVFSIIWEGDKFFVLHKIIAERERLLTSASPGSSVAIPSIPFGMADKYWVLGAALPDLGYNPDFWVNRAMAAHYGSEKVFLIPQPVTPYKPQEYEYARYFEKVSFQNDIINVFISPHLGMPKQVYFYYYGKPALLSYLPVSIGKKLFGWLKAGDQRSWRKYLIPILLARTDIELVSHDSGAAGESPEIRVIDDTMLWAVRPGDSKYSFQLIPLEKE